MDGTLLTHDGVVIAVAVSASGSRTVSAVYRVVVGFEALETNLRCEGYFPALGERELLVALVGDMVPTAE